jgi:hypothetical protein
MSSFVTCPINSPLCLQEWTATTDVQVETITSLQTVDMCTEVFCTGIFASSVPHIGMPEQFFQQAMTAVNASCNHQCMSANLTALSNGSTHLNGMSVLCPLSCASNGMPNITFRLATGNDGTSGPVYVDFPITSDDYTSVFTPDGGTTAYLRVLLNSYAGSLPSEMDILLGIPFLKAYYSIFDASQNAGMLLPLVERIHAIERFSVMSCLFLQLASLPHVLWRLNLHHLGQVDKMSSGDLLPCGASSLASLSPRCLVLVATWLFETAFGNHAGKQHTHT